MLYVTLKWFFCGTESHLLCKPRLPPSLTALRQTLSWSLQLLLIFARLTLIQSVLDIHSCLQLFTVKHMSSYTESRQQRYALHFNSALTSCINLLFKTLRWLSVKLRFFPLQDLESYRVSRDCWSWRQHQVRLWKDLKSTRSITLDKFSGWKDSDVWTITSCQSRDIQQGHHNTLDHTHKLTTSELIYSFFLK